MPFVNIHLKSQSHVVAPTPMIPAECATQQVAVKSETTGDTFVVNTHLKVDGVPTTPTVPVLNLGKRHKASPSPKRPHRRDLPDGEPNPNEAAPPTAGGDEEGEEKKEVVDHDSGMTAEEKAKFAACVNQCREEIEKRLADPATQEKVTKAIHMIFTLLVVIVARILRFWYKFRESKRYQEGRQKLDAKIQQKYSSNLDEQVSKFQGKLQKVHTFAETHVVAPLKLRDSATKQGQLFNLATDLGSRVLSDARQRAL